MTGRLAELRAQLDRALVELRADELPELVQIGQLARVAPDLSGIVNVDPDQLELGILDERSQRVRPHRAGCPLNHPVGRMRHRAVVSTDHCGGQCLRASTVRSSGRPRYLFARGTSSTSASSGENSDTATSRKPASSMMLR